MEEWSALMVEIDLNNVGGSQTVTIGSGSSSADWANILGKPAVIAAGADAATARAAIGAAQSLVATAVKTSAYTAAVGDLIPVDATSAAVTVTLPTAPADKTLVAIKKVDASANVVTVARGGSDVFNKSGGSTALTLSVQFQAVTVQYSGGVWYVIGGDLPSTTVGRGLVSAVDAKTARSVIDTMAFHPVAYLDPSTRPDGSFTAGDPLDQGVWFGNTGPKKLKYVSGRIVHDPAATSGSSSAGYGQIDTRKTSSGSPSGAAADLVRQMRGLVAWPASAIGAVAFVCPSALATWDWDAGILPAAGFHLTAYGNGPWTVGVWNPGSGGAANGQIHHSVQPGTATSFTLTVQDTASTQTTGSITTATATAASVQAVLVALSNVGAGKVNVTKSASGNYGITWDSSLGTVTLTATGTGMGMAAPLPTNSANTIPAVVSYGTGITNYADYTTVKRYGTVWDNVLRPLEVFVYPETDTAVIAFPDGGNSGPIIHPGIGLWTSSRAVFEIFESNISSVDVPATYGQLAVNNVLVPAGSPLVDKPGIMALIRSMVIKGWDFATTVSAGGTTTLTADSAIVQQVTGSAAHTFALPSTNVQPGTLCFVLNGSTGVVTVNASGGTIVTALASGNNALFIAVAAAPTTPGGWVALPFVTLSGAQSVTSKTFTSSNWARAINAQTGTTYTLVLADRGKTVTMNNASASTLTIPLNSSAALPVGEIIELIQLGAGQVTIAATGGVTVLATPGLKIAGQGGKVELQKVATDTWVASGSLST